MVTMRDFGLEGASSILAMISSIYFFFTCFPTFFLHHLGNPDMTDNKQRMSSASGKL